MMFPMWDNEAERIGFAKATPAGQAARSRGELAGLGFLLCVPAVPVVWLWRAVFGGGGFPFGLPAAAGVFFVLRMVAGVIHDRLAGRVGFRYDAAAREASWDTPGGRVWYRYGDGAPRDRPAGPDG